MLLANVFKVGRLKKTRRNLPLVPKSAPESYRLSIRRKSLRTYLQMTKNQRRTRLNHLKMFPCKNTHSPYHSCSRKSVSTLTRRFTNLANSSIENLKKIRSNDCAKLL